MNLSDDDSGDGQSSGFAINKDYAQRYDKWRKSEELQKLKDKYGDDFEGSSSSEDEDDNAAELTPQIEADFYKTLAYLKEKNPKIYDSNVRFFEDKKEDGESGSAKIKKKEKVETMSLAAYHRKNLIETNGVIEEENRDNISHLPMAQQEKALKESFKAAMAAESDSEDGADAMGGLFKAKTQTVEEKEKNETDYKQWLAGQTEAEPKQADDWKGLRDYWSNPELNDGEKFLRDYILNQKYLDKQDDEEIDYFLSSDDETVAKQEEFERKFNFRYQEPDQDFIKRFPRTVEQSMRKKDDRRKKHREEVKDRKLKERAQKDEELKRLKALKREEIMEKIKKLQEVTGNDDLAFQDQDIEGEFDPEEHDKRMSELFGNDYYGTNVDEKKPEFPELDEELEIENWEQWRGEDGGEQDMGQPSYEPHCEDGDFVMDCDYDPALESQKEILDSTKRRRKRKQSKFAEALANPKPKFDPSNAKFEKYLDEYYSLNYEDIIDDIPCRFKYRKTVPNDFGLTIEEILSAPDKELNRWASAKKIMRRRPDHVELYEVKAYKKKALSEALKKQCLPSLYAPPDDQETSENTLTTSAVPNELTPAVKHKRRRRKKGGSKDEVTNSTKLVRKRKTSDSNKSNDNSRNNGTTEGQVSAKPDDSAGVKLGKKTKKRTKDEQTRQETKKPKLDKQQGKKTINTGGSSLNPKNVTVQDSSAKIVSVKNKKSKAKIQEKKRSIFERRHKSQLSKSGEPINNISDNRLKAYGLNPKKFKNKMKYGPKKSS